MARLLAPGEAGEDPKVAAFSCSLQGLWDHLWTFAHQAVPPTNNQVERALRCAVLWRKTSFGSASGKGLRFVERMLSLSETCRQNGVYILDYLTRAIVAHRQPRLLLCALILWPHRRWVVSSSPKTTGPAGAKRRTRS